MVVNRVTSWVIEISRPLERVHSSSLSQQEETDHHTLNSERRPLWMMFAAGLHTI